VSPRPAGPRVRVRAGEARVRSGAGALVDGWLPLADGAVLLRVLGARGPAVSLRVTARDGRFFAGFSADPAAVHIFVDGSDMGGTPLASTPLAAGTRTIRLQDEAGGETRFTLELAP
jgi:hypothetical protein